MQKPIREYLSRSLEWNQPKALRMEYELRAGDERVATLKFRSSFGSFATAHTADGVWTMKRVGFLRTRVTVREEGSGTDLAVFRNDTWKSGGTLELPEGRHYRATTNFWQTRFQIQTPQERTLIDFHHQGVLHLSGTMTVSREAAELPELPWLICLGWYLLVMLHHDSAAGAAAGG